MAVRTGLVGWVAALAIVASGCYMGIGIHGNKTRFEPVEEQPNLAATEAFDVSVMISLGVKFATANFIALPAYAHTGSEIETGGSRVHAGQHLLSLRGNVPLTNEGDRDVRHGLFAPVGVAFGKGNVDVEMEAMSPVKRDSSALNLLGGLGYGIAGSDCCGLIHFFGGVVANYRRNVSDEVGTVTAIGGGVDMILDLTALFGGK